VKICCTGDWHLRSTNPRNRVDDFFRTQLSKVIEVFKVAREHDCKAILQPGDLWDSYNPSRLLMAVYMKLLLDNKNIPVLTVLGQHDMAMRSFQAVNRTASFLFDCAGALKIVGLDEKPYFLVEDEKEPKTDVVAVWGMSFGQGDYTPKRIKDVFNIVLAHASVGDKALYEGHELTHPKEFLKNRLEADLAVLGDYHYAFSDEYEGRQILNTGCLVRKTVAQKDLELIPTVIIYDTKTRQMIEHVLEFKDVEEVFSIPELGMPKEHADIRRFIDRLHYEKVFSMSFEENLKKFFDKAKVNSNVSNYIIEELGMVSEESKS